MVHHIEPFCQTLAARDLEGVPATRINLVDNERRFHEVVRNLKYQWNPKVGAVNNYNIFKKNSNKWHSTMKRHWYRSNFFLTRFHFRQLRPPLVDHKEWDWTTFAILMKFWDLTLRSTCPLTFLFENVGWVVRDLRQCPEFFLLCVMEGTPIFMIMMTHRLLEFGDSM